MGMMKEALIERYDRAKEWIYEELEALGREPTLEDYVRVVSNFDEFVNRERIRRIVRSLSSPAKSVGVGVAEEIPRTTPDDGGASR